MATNETLLQLIELVKKNPCLYDPKDQSFKDRVKRNEIWQAIAEDLKISSIDAKTYWERLRRKYLLRRSKDLPSETNFDKTMSFLEGCCGFEQSRSEMKPQLPSTSTPSSSTAPMALASSSTNDSNHQQPATTSDGGPSSSLSTSAIASSSTCREDTKHHWMDLLFEELSQKGRQFPIGKQLDIAKQVSQIFEEAAGETVETGEPDEVDCSYIA